MNEAVGTSPRWRLFANTVAVALGLNVWLGLVFIPVLYGGLLGRGSMQLLTALPVAVLALGIIRHSEHLLLLAFPSTLLLPVGAAPELTAQQGPVRFFLLAAGLLAFLFGASVLTSFREMAAPAAQRRLTSAAQPLAQRWKRRLRIYRALAVLSAIYPAVLLYYANFDGDLQEAIRAMYPGRAAAMAGVMNLAVAVTWILVYGAFFLGTLKPHRTGDRDLQFELALLRRDAGRARPRRRFFIGVLAALVFMALLLLIRGL